MTELDARATNQVNIDAELPRDHAEQTVLQICIHSDDEGDLLLMHEPAAVGLHEAKALAKPKKYRPLGEGLLEHRTNLQNLSSSTRKVRKPTLTKMGFQINGLK